MELTIRPFQTTFGALHTALLGSGANRGLGATAGLAQHVLGRYAHTPARLSPLEMALRRAQPGYSWQATWHLHLAAHLRLAILTGPEAGSTAIRGEDRPAGASFWTPQPASPPVAAERVMRQVLPLVERLQARGARLSTLDTRRAERAGAHDPPLAAPPQPPTATPSGPRPGEAAVRVLLRRAGPAAPDAAQLAAQISPPAATAPAGPQPRTGQTARPPGLRLDQFPAHEVSRLAEQVIQTIDRRILAQRERLGRM